MIHESVDDFHSVLDLSFLSSSVIWVFMYLYLLSVLMCLLLLNIHVLPTRTIELCNRNTDAEFFFVCVPITLFVLDTPGVSISAWEVIRRQAADLFSWESHPRAFIMARPRITEVSLSSASVIAASGSNPNFAYKFYRSPRMRVLAHLRFGSTFRSMQVTYLMKWIFNFQRSLSGGFCPLTTLMAKKRYGVAKKPRSFFRIFSF